MRSYRIYAYAPDTPPSSQLDVECQDDHDAMQVAARLIAAGGSADLWEGTRYVRRIIAPHQAGGQPVDEVGIGVPATQSLQ